MLAASGVPEDHVARPFVRTKADGDQFEYQTWAVTTPALICLLAHWANNLQATFDKERARQLLEGIL
eukprot:16437741-Heterocapsa_arctica.AAC.1